MTAPTGPPTTYVVLLRGVNVGRSRRLAMADLRAMCEEEGATEVSTYVQSGNVVLRSELGPAELEAALERRIEASTGFGVAVVARTAAEVAEVVAGLPFDPGTDPTKLVVVFLKGALPAGALDGLDLASYAPEELVAAERELYLHLPGGQGRSQLSHALLEKAVRIPATARNWRSVTKLADLAGALAGTS